VYSNPVIIAEKTVLEAAQDLQKSILDVKKYDVMFYILRTDFCLHDNLRLSALNFCLQEWYKVYSAMEIRVFIPRPWILLTVIVFIVLWTNGVLSFRFPAKNNDAVGGQGAGSVVTDLRTTFDRENVKRAVLERKEEILRFELLELERRIDGTTDEGEKEKLRQIRSSLLATIREKNAVETMMTESLLAMWEAEGVEFTTEPQNVTELFSWPVAPTLGISAFFRDESYRQRFGFDHHAIDIPTVQGTTIIAPAAGIVQKVALNGLGYSYVTLLLDNGLEVTFGHITTSLVRTGDTVLRGQAVAKSGGEIGSEGAGPFTTGPHVHFVVKNKGLLVDPLQFLPKMKGITQ
jgi:murein DD-endopeptidase MepM/ murein hydrolase activator NlpD